CGCRRWKVGGLRAQKGSPGISEGARRFPAFNGGGPGAGGGGGAASGGGGGRAAQGGPAWSATRRMIVIADTGPINYLVLIGEIHVFDWRNTRIASALQPCFSPAFGM